MALKKDKRYISLFLDHISKELDKIDILAFWSRSSEEENILDNESYSSMVHF